MTQRQDHMHHRVFGRLVLAGTVRNMTLSLTGMIDSAVTGRYLGEAGLSALKLAAPLFAGMSIFSVVLAGGLSIVLVGELAEGHRENAKRLFRMAFTLVTLLSLLFTLFGILCPDRITSLLAGNAEPAVRDMTTAYIRFILFAAFPIMMYDLFGSASLLEGEHRRLVAASAVIFVTDIVGDALAVHLDLGMGGIAAASAAAYLLAFLTVFVHFLGKHTNLSVGLEMPRLKQLSGTITAGLPLAVLYLCRILRPLAVNRFILGYGTTTGLAGLSVQDAISYFPDSFCTGLADTSLLLAAIYTGEEDREGLKQLGRMILFWALIPGLLIMITGIVLSSALAGIFTSDPSVIRYGALALRLYFPGVVFAALNQSVCACLQGIGKKKEAAVVQVVWGLAVPVFCAFLLGRQYGDTGVYLAFSVWQFVSFLLILGAYGICRLMHKPLLPQTMVRDELRSAITSLAESAAVSETIHAFCRKHNVPERMAVHAALCAQELCDNSLTHGFKDGRKHHLEVRVVLRPTDLILRVRDNGRPFDLTERYRMIHPEDPSKNIGLRMIYAAADEVSYSSALRLNNVCIRVQLPQAESIL